MSNLIDLLDSLRQMLLSGTEVQVTCVQPVYLLA